MTTNHPQPAACAATQAACRADVWLTSAYLGPVQYYARLYAARTVMEERNEHYLKQTYRNRCYIATPAGPQPLTIPVVRDAASHTPTRDIRISDHGNWRHLHWTALASAYEGSPFFLYYADDFRPLYERRYTFLVDFNKALQTTVLGLLDLSPRILLTPQYTPPTPDAAARDLRELISPKRPLVADPAFTPVPYYQVFAARTGFLPNLSILDLLFNMGPESRLVLRGSLRPAAPQPAEHSQTPAQG